MERWQGAPARYRNTPGAKQCCVARIKGTHMSSANETTQHTRHTVVVMKNKPTQGLYSTFQFAATREPLCSTTGPSSLQSSKSNNAHDYKCIPYTLYTLWIPWSGNDGNVLPKERPASWSKFCWLLIPKKTLSLIKTHLQHTKMRGNSRRHCTFTPLHRVLPVDVMQTTTANWYCAIEIEEVSTSTNICNGLFVEHMRFPLSMFAREDT